MLTLVLALIREHQVAVLAFFLQLSEALGEPPETEVLFKQCVAGAKQKNNNKKRGSLPSKWRNTPKQNLRNCLGYKYIYRRETQDAVPSDHDDIIVDGKVIQCQLKAGHCSESLLHKHVGKKVSQEADHKAPLLNTAVL